MSEKKAHKDLKREYRGVLKLYEDHRSQKRSD